MPTAPVLAAKGKAQQQLGVTEAKTKVLMGRLKGLGLPEGPTLLVVSERTDNLDRAARNLPWLSVETPTHASVYQVLRNDRVLFEKAALLGLQDTLSRSASRAAAEL